MTKNPIIYKFFKDFTNHRKRTDSGVVFSSIPFPNILENKTLSDTYLRDQLVCMKVQAHSSLEPPTEYNQDQMPLMNQGLL